MLGGGWLARTGALALSAEEAIGVCADLSPPRRAYRCRRRQATAHAEIAQAVAAARDICNPYRAAEARQPAKRRPASRTRR